MSIADELKGVRSEFPTRCRVAIVLKDPALSVKDVRAINQAIENPDLPATGISRSLAKHGIRLGGDSIRRHRNKVCRCDNR
jgi:hypothetical protein